MLTLLAFPAAALAAGGEDEKTGGPRVGDAEVAELAPLQRPVDRFHRVIRTISADIRAEERALARKREREREERFTSLGVSMAT
ncbi:MAG TPA: hypothetical protein VF030_05750, partial [Solirubrobacterales bacterium]